MLLIIEALLLILAALRQDHRAAVEGDIITLDMAPNSVDDQYEGCREKMANLVETEYLQEELKNPKYNFKQTWKLCEKKIKEKRDNLNRNHLIAICVYTDAIQILKRQQNECRTIYRRTKDEYKLEKGKEFRFGSFASFSLDYSETILFGDKSCFEIKKYKVAELTDYSKMPDEKEVLIPPYETFKVTDIKTRRDQKDLWCDTLFILENTGIRSDLNCALFESPIKKMIKNLFCGCCGSQTS